jgi:choline kinase
MTAAYSRTSMVTAKPSSLFEAVIIMAGSGSRLRSNGRSLIKPLVPVLGRPLISYTFEMLANAGIRTVYSIVGFESESLVAQLPPLIPRDLDVRFVENRNWKKQNGVSVLVAANYVHSPFLLTMSDHLFDQSIVDLLLGGSRRDQLNLAIDRKLDSVFDLNDAMKVKTRGDRMIAIGKDLKDYDAIDVGLSVCPPQIFAYLEQAKHDGDCSLAEGVRLMAGDDKVRVADIGDAWWQDVDTAEMLQHAEKVMQAREQALLGQPGKNYWNPSHK